MCIIFSWLYCGVLGRGAARPECSEGGQRPAQAGHAPSYIILRVGCSQKSQKFIWACRLAIIEAVPRCTMKKAIVLLEYYYSTSSTIVVLQIYYIGATSTVGQLQL